MTELDQYLAMLDRAVILYTQRTGDWVDQNQVVTPVVYVDTPGSMAMFDAVSGLLLRIS